MASIKVSELTEATDFNTNDYAMIVQSNQSKKITKANIFKEQKNSERYLTSEVTTNKTWIDGSSIYRKVIDFGYLPNTTSKTVSSGLSNVIITNMYGVAKHSTGVTLTIPEANGSNTIRLAYTENNEVLITTSYDRSAYYGYIILEYIKTNN